MTAIDHRLRVTLVFEYDAHRDSYDTDDPSEMVAIDQKVFEDNPSMLFETRSKPWVTSIAVEHVQNGSCSPEPDGTEPNIGEGS